MISTLESFRKMIDVNAPIISICHHDFVRVDDTIAQAVGRRKVTEWNPATRTTNFALRTHEGSLDADHDTLEAFLLREYANETPFGVPNRVLLLRECHALLDQPGVVTLLALLAQRKLYDRAFESFVVMVDSVAVVPEEIRPYVSYLDIALPDDRAINALIDQHIEINQYDPAKFTDADRAELMPSLKGLTEFEIDRMLDMAMSSNGSLGADDRAMILEQKKRMVKSSGVLELVDTPESIDDVGGLDALKAYLRRKADIYSRLAEAYRSRVAVPKGVFIVGMPGCGKSLCAKAAAGLFGAPLLKMDMGRMMGRYLGESEANLRKALKIAEAAAPCVLWIDEIEKGFAGAAKGDNDSLTRMFGSFLGWMQDKKSAVYVIATANNAEGLPPELKRKGRFDEIFCVNLPNADERKAIVRVHLKRRGQSLSDAALTSLAKATEGFNGADLEAVVNEAMETAFVAKNGKEGKEGKEGKDAGTPLCLTVQNLLDTARQSVGIARSCGKQIKQMASLFAENSFKDATSGKITSNR